MFQLKNSRDKKNLVAKEVLVSVSNGLVLFVQKFGLMVDNTINPRELSSDLVSPDNVTK